MKKKKLSEFDLESLEVQRQINLAHKQLTFAGYDQQYLHFVVVRVKGVYVVLPRTRPYKAKKGQGLVYDTEHGWDFDEPVDRS